LLFCFFGGAYGFLSSVTSTHIMLVIFPFFEQRANYIKNGKTYFFQLTDIA
jgi:hypothetical protein